MGGAVAGGIDQETERPRVGGERSALTSAAPTPRNSGALGIDLLARVAAPASDGPDTADSDVEADEEEPGLVLASMKVSTREIEAEGASKLNFLAIGELQSNDGLSCMSASSSPPPRLGTRGSTTSFRAKAAAR